jgi:hypothetical protein
MIALYVLEGGAAPGIPVKLWDVLTDRLIRTFRGAGGGL